MSDYDYEEKRSSNQSSRGHYGYSSKPIGITIHHWGSTGQKHDNVVGWLRGSAGGTSNRGSSAHLVTSAGRVTRLVPDDRASWHAGSTAGNGSTIGIECRPEMSADDWDTLVELCADLEEKHGSLKYYKHSDWKNTACPGKYANRIGDLVDAVNAEHARRKSGESKPKPKPAPSKPAGKVPGPGHAFPWPAGHYIGPKSGPDRSHSGFYKNRKWSGQYDEYWIKELVDQFERRGWDPENDYLVKYGNDGRYGEELESLFRAFQRTQGLTVDGLAGREVWDEAFTEPVT